MTKTFKIPIELKRNCDSALNTIQTPSTLENDNGVALGTLTSPLGSIWQEKIAGDNNIGFEFEPLTN